MKELEGLQPEPPYQEEGELGREFTPEEMREKLRDPSFLPSHEVLSGYFRQFDGFSQYEDGNVEWEKWRHLLFNGEHPIFEIWTQEYIHALGSYLAQRVEELGGTEENPTVVLEVGAGDGRLTYFLQREMDELMPGKVKIVASDSGDWGITPDFPVETISHKEALEKYKPNIVIFSWMPYRYDYTFDFRAIGSVEEYVLIGEAGGVCCGDAWQTWGLNWTYDEEERKLRESQPAPYEVDGFEKVCIEGLSTLQLSRANLYEENILSSTVSFKRKSKT